MVLDLFAEVKPIWSTSEQFYGVPYIWKVPILLFSIIFRSFISEHTKSFNRFMLVNRDYHKVAA